MRRAADDFRDIVWPDLRDHLGGGEIIPTEAHESDAEQCLDVVAGIDWLHVRPNEQLVRGLGVRVQPSYHYATFTVRVGRASGAMTEFQKRMTAMSCDLGFYGDLGRKWLYPELTIQAYINAEEGALIGAGWVNTLDLYGFVAREWDRLDELPNPADGTRFKVVPFAHLRSEGVEVEAAYEDNLTQYNTRGAA